MENLGDIDRQTIAGAISTGTHGTGARLGNISSQVEAVELVLADGSVRELSAAADPELLRAARVGHRRAGRDLGGDPALRPGLHPAAGRHSAPARGGARRASASAPTPTTTIEFFTFPYADSALVLERNRTDEPPRPRGRAAAYLNDVVLENWALEALAATGKALPRGDPARWPASPPASPPAAGRPTAATASSPTSGGSASPRWSTRCRASTAPRRRAG